MTPIFFKNIKDPFYIVNLELEKISHQYKANKLSIDIKKTKLRLFHENSFKDEAPLNDWMDMIKIASMAVNDNI